MSTWAGTFQDLRQLISPILTRLMRISQSPCICAQQMPGTDRIRLEDLSQTTKQGQTSAFHHHCACFASMHARVAVLQSFGDRAVVVEHENGDRRIIPVLDIVVPLSHASCLMKKPAFRRSSDQPQPLGFNRLDRNTERGMITAACNFFYFPSGATF